MDFLTYLPEGFKMFKRSLSININGFKSYSGDWKEICNKSVKSCWNGSYFQVSTGNFVLFYTRDFGFCLDSLIKLGYKEECFKTLEYALSCFQKHNRVSVAINSKGVPFDFPDFGIDSLPYLIRSINLVDKKGILLKRYHSFLNVHIDYYFERVYDKKTGLVKKENFSSMKDHSKRISSCYSNCFMLMLKNELAKTSLNNPFKIVNDNIIEKNFWNGKFFYDDLTKSNFFSSDANIFPFWLGIVKDKKKLRLVISKIQSLKLDNPIPLAYSSNKDNSSKMILLSNLVGDYETVCRWTHMGPLYVSLVKSVDPKLYSHYKSAYHRSIEKYGNLFEVYTPQGKPYKTLVYSTDNSMLWAANVLTM